MTIQFSIPVRNARLDAVATVIGASAKLIIYSGAQPADCSEAPSGTVLATLSLPSSWMLAASSGSKSKTGTWSDTSADAGGTAGHFRIYDSLLTTCGLQGSITVTGGAGDMTLDNTTIVAGQTVTITSFVLTDGNA
jgi:hypothetical protein